MNYNKKTVKDIDVAGKKVLLRCDFNVPQDKATGVITDDKRIVAALPTIQYLLEQNAAVIACSHLGKPKEGPDPKFSLAPVAKRLSELLGREVIMAADVVGPDATAKAAALNHETAYDAVEGKSVIETVLCQLQVIRHRNRRLVPVQRDGNGPIIPDRNLHMMFPGCCLQVFR